MDTHTVTALLNWTSSYGLLGVFMIGIAERFVPFLPSTGLLLAIGVGASSGAWSPQLAILASSFGSLMGCAAWYYVARRIGDEHSTHVLFRAGRLFGLSPERVKASIEHLKRKNTALAFTSQLLPTVRLFSPAFAAVIGAEWRTFLAASAAGILVWNAIFILTGYLAASWIDPDKTMLVLITLCSVLVIIGIRFIGPLAASGKCAPR